MTRPLTHRIDELPLDRRIAGESRGLRRDNLIGALYERRDIDPTSAHVKRRKGSIRVTDAQPKLLGMTTNADDAKLTIDHAFSAGLTSSWTVFGTLAVPAIPNTAASYQRILALNGYELILQWDGSANWALTVLSGGGAVVSTASVPLAVFFDVQFALELASTGVLSFSFWTVGIGTVYTTTSPVTTPDATAERITLFGTSATLANSIKGVVLNNVLVYDADAFDSTEFVAIANDTTPETETTPAVSGTLTNLLWHSTLADGGTVTAYTNGAGAEILGYSVPTPPTVYGTTPTRMLFGGNGVVEIPFYLDFDEYFWTNANASARLDWSFQLKVTLPEVLSVSTVFELQDLVGLRIVEDGGVYNFQANYSDTALVKAHTEALVAGTSYEVFVSRTADAVSIKVAGVAQTQSPAPNPIIYAYDKTIGFTLGDRVDFDNSDPFGGQVELFALFNGTGEDPVFGERADAVFYYDVDSVQGDEVLDRGNRSLHGFSGVRSTSRPPFFREGAFLGGAYVAATGGYLISNSTPSLGYTGELRKAILKDAVVQRLGERAFLTSNGVSYLVNDRSKTFRPLGINRPSTKVSCTPQGIGPIDGFVRYAYRFVTNDGTVGPTADLDPCEATGGVNVFLGAEALSASRDPVFGLAYGELEGSKTVVADEVECFVVKGQDSAGTNLIAAEVTDPGLTMEVAFRVPSFGPSVLISESVVSQGVFMPHALETVSGVIGSNRWFAFNEPVEFPWIGAPSQEATIQLTFRYSLSDGLAGAGLLDVGTEARLSNQVLFAIGNPHQRYHTGSWINETGHDRCHLLLVSIQENGSPSLTPAATVAAPKTQLVVTRQAGDRDNALREEGFDYHFQDGHDYSLFVSRSGQEQGSQKGADLSVAIFDHTANDLVANTGWYQWPVSTTAQVVNTSFFGPNFAYSNFSSVMWGTGVRDGGQTNSRTRVWRGPTGATFPESFQYHYISPFRNGTRPDGTGGQRLYHARMWTKDINLNLLSAKGLDRYGATEGPLSDQCKIDVAFCSDSSEESLTGGWDQINEVRAEYYSTPANGKVSADVQLASNINQTVFMAYGFDNTIVAAGNDNALGSELVTNGDFTTDSDWTKLQSTVSGGVCRINTTGTDASITQTSSGFTASQSNLITVTLTITAYVSGSLRARFAGDSTYHDIPASVGTHRVTFFNNGTSGQLEIVNTGATDITFDDLSVKQVYTYGSELVTNGTFDTDITSWTDDSERSGSSQWDGVGQLELLNPAADPTEEGAVYQSMAVVVGQTYRIRITRSDDNSYVLIGTALSNGSYYTLGGPIDGSGSTDILVIPTTTTLFITLRNYNYSESSTLIDNVSVMEQTGVGANLVVNGDFATDTVWTKGTGWAIASGKATYTFGADSNLTQSSILTSGYTYELGYEVVSTTLVGGTLKVADTAASDGNVLPQTVGVHTVAFDADGTAPTNLDIRVESATSGSIAIDNVTIREVSILVGVDSAAVHNVTTTDKIPLWASYSTRNGGSLVVGTGQTPAFELAQRKWHDGSNVVTFDGFANTIDLKEWTWLTLYFSQVKRVTSVADIYDVWLERIFIDGNTGEWGDLYNADTSPGGPGGLKIAAAGVGLGTQYTLGGVPGLDSEFEIELCESRLWAGERYSALGGGNGTSTFGPYLSSRVPPNLWAFMWHYIRFAPADVNDLTNQLTIDQFGLKASNATTPTSMATSDAVDIFQGAEVKSGETSGSGGALYYVPFPTPSMSSVRGIQLFRSQIVPLQETFPTGNVNPNASLDAFKACRQAPLYYLTEIPDGTDFYFDSAVDTLLGPQLDVSEGLIPRNVGGVFEWGGFIGMWVTDLPRIYFAAAPTSWESFPTDMLVDIPLREYGPIEAASELASRDARQARVLVLGQSWGAFIDGTPLRPIINTVGGGVGASSSRCLVVEKGVAYAYNGTLWAITGDGNIEDIGMPVLDLLPPTGDARLAVSSALGSLFVINEASGVALRWHFARGEWFVEDRSCVGVTDILGEDNWVHVSGYPSKGDANTYADDVDAATLTSYAVSAMGTNTVTLDSVVGIKVGQRITVTAEEDPRERQSVTVSAVPTGGGLTVTVDETITLPATGPLPMATAGSTTTVTFTYKAYVGVGYWGTMLDTGQFINKGTLNYVDMGITSGDRWHGMLAASDFARDPSQRSGFDDLESHPTRFVDGSGDGTSARWGLTSQQRVQRLLIWTMEPSAVGLSELELNYTLD